MCYLKKKIIIAVVVIVALIIGVLGYMVIFDMGQEDKLKTELSEINDLAMQKLLIWMRSTRD